MRFWDNFGKKANFDFGTFDWSGTHLCCPICVILNHTPAIEVNMEEEQPMLGWTLASPGSGDCLFRGRGPVTKILTLRMGRNPLETQFCPHSENKVIFCNSNKFCTLTGWTHNPVCSIAARLEIQSFLSKTCIVDQFWHFCSHLQSDWCFAKTLDILLFLTFLRKKLNFHFLKSLFFSLLPISTVVWQVRHRWCELVVKHKYSKAYSDVETFLLNDQVRF